MSTPAQVVYCKQPMTKSDDLRSGVVNHPADYGDPGRNTCATDSAQIKSSPIANQLDCAIGHHVRQYRIV
jgi:hypothetical protein